MIFFYINTFQIFSAPFRNQEFKKNGRKMTGSLCFDEQFSSSKIPIPRFCTVAVPRHKKTKSFFNQTLLDKSGTNKKTKPEPRTHTWRHVGSIPQPSKVYSLILADNGICCNFKSEIQSNVGEGGQKQLHDPVLLSGHSRSAIYAQHWVSTKWHVGSTPSVILETNRFRPCTYGMY